MTFRSPGRFTWKPSVSWVVGIRCHWQEEEGESSSSPKGWVRTYAPGPARGLRPLLCPPGAPPCAPEPQASAHLHQVVVRPVQFLVQLNDEALKEGRKLPLLFARLGM